MIRKNVKSGGGKGASRRAIAALCVAVALLAAAAAGLYAAFSALARVWREQCRVTDRELDVVIATSGKMVHPDVITMTFGLTNGANLAEIPFDDRRRKLMAIPNIRDVRIERRMPHRVTVEVTEREPIARVAPRKGSAAAGRVADSDGVVFWYNSNTIMHLPIVREPDDRPVPPGKRLEGQAAAALRLVEAAAQPELAGKLRVLEIDTSNKDYLVVTLGNYDRAKIAWDHMLDDSRLSRESLHSQLVKLASAIDARLTPHGTMWLATEWGKHNRITASGPNTRLGN